MDRQLSMLQHRMFDTDGISLNNLETLTKKNCSLDQKLELYSCLVESDNISVTNPEGQEEKIDLKIKIVVSTDLENDHRWWLEILKFERPAWMEEEDN